ncbi:MAG: nuclear transport factor 2 family protein [Acidobacteriota bacterium]
MKIARSRTCGILLAAFFAGASAGAQSTASLSTGDRNAIQELMTLYSQALSGCRTAEFADLFVPETGSFASGFRGRMVGRDRLIALVQSERQCVAPAAPAAAARPGGAAGPTVVLDVTPSGVRGIASLGTTEYQDEYVKTPQGWRFASRTVVIAAEKAAGLEARDMLAIQRLGGAKLADHYEADQNGVPRLMTSGIKLGVSGGQVTGRAYLKDGAYDDEVYEKLGPGEWRVKSSTHVPSLNPNR